MEEFFTWRNLKSNFKDERSIKFESGFRSLTHTHRFSMKLRQNIHYLNSIGFNIKFSNVFFLLF